MTKKYNIAAFIQVRMASKRLPGKALCDINGLTAIERVVNNLKPSKYINNIVIVTAKGKENDPIADIAEKKGINYFRGDEVNVVQRFIGAAKKFNTDIVARVTGDCPLISFEITDYLIENHLESEVDYTGIEIDSVPIGTFSEIINFSALQKLTDIDVDLSYGEYMTFYFRNNPEYFSINILPVK
ncbi:MAG: NTP transferase domain-containing protein [Candidatus Melainabacteria bacterium]|nr:NTP transferase domain-containing protein [Candidatus Melainabacteria bacterium]